MSVQQITRTVRPAAALVLAITAGWMVGNFSMASAQGTQPLSNWLNALPSQAILMWRGPLPHGWHECDGSQNTPDLRNKYIVGAETDADQFKSYGAANLQISIPPHDHRLRTSGPNFRTPALRVLGGSQVIYHETTADDVVMGISDAKGVSTEVLNQPIAVKIRFICKL